MDKTVPPGRVKGTLTPPCSKSYAQRALAAALLSEEVSVLRNIEFCDDTRSALQCIETLGARVRRVDPTSLSIEGGLSPKGCVLNVGESGLSTRLFTPVASLCPTPVTIEGRGSLLRRPMQMMFEPLRRLGVRVRDNGGFLPIEVCGPIQGGEAEVDGSVSSQFITGLLLALPLARRDTSLHVRGAVSTPYLDMTLDTAARFGIEISQRDYEEFYIPGRQRYRSTYFSIEGDWSAAAMLLVAINWKNRDEKPWREVLSMMLLCLTSSYGLVIAGMFAANWVVRFVWQEHSLIRNRRRFIALLALLAAAMAILIDVMPAKDVYSGNFDISGMTQPAPLWMQICNSWLLLPAEALFTSTVSDTNLVFIGLSPTLLYTGTVSCLMWAPLIHISRRRHNAMLLLSSYTVMCLVFAQHFSMHHLGILLGFFIAVLAIDCDERRIGVDDWPAWCATMADQFAGKLGVKKARNYLIMLKALALGAMLISVYWTINASICDIRYEYSSSRTVASFIKTNHLEQYRWMAGWTRINSTNASPDVKARIKQGGYCANGKDCIDYTSWVSGTLVTADPYFKRTLMSNAYKGRSYISWEWCIDPYAGKQDIETWRSWGEPEFYDTIYQPFFFSALGYDRNDYTKIRIAETVTPWKDQRSRGSVEIYVRNDIYKNVLHSPDTGIAWPDGAKRR